MDLFGWLRRLWQQHQENKKRQELYARLDRNAAGKFSKKQYMKDIKKVVTLKKDKK